MRVRRLHKKPDTSEIEACKWWLRIEAALVKPKLFVALGATAAQSLTGNGRDILKRRSHFEQTAEGERDGDLRSEAETVPGSPPRCRDEGLAHDWSL